MCVIYREEAKNPANVMSNMIRDPNNMTVYIYYTCIYSYEIKAFTACMYVISILIPEQQCNYYINIRILAAHAQHSS
mgnify:CR=1 FL=1